MDLSTPFISAMQLALVPLVMALTSLLKNAELSGKDHRWSPITAFVLGSASVWLIPSATWQLTLLAGATIGVLAAGVYSGVKTTVAPNA